MKQKILFIILLLIIIFFIIINFNKKDSKLINGWFNNKNLLYKYEQKNLMIEDSLKVEFISETTYGSSQYYTSVNRLFKIYSDSDLKTIKICTTTKDKCIPNKYYLKKDKIYSVSFEDNKKEQRICVYAKNKDGEEITTCDKKTYKVDSFRPKLDIKEFIVYIDGEEKYDVDTNYKVKFGVSGGNVYCDNTDNLKIGENEIKCIAVGNNGERILEKFFVIMSPTYNKKVAFFGDSITLGSGSKDLKSWAYYIGKNYDLKKSYNNGENGATLGKVENWNQLRKIVVAKKIRIMIMLFYMVVVTMLPIMFQ